MLKKNQFLIFSLFLSMLYFGAFDLYSQNVGPITISSYKTDDDADAWGDDKSNGDGDKVVEQGEKIRLPIVLKNNGTASANDVKAILKTISASITVVDSVKDYKMIEAGKEKDIAGTWRDGFHFKVSNTAQTGEVIFTLKITTSNGGSFSDSLTIYIKGGGVVGPLEIVRFQIDDDVDNWGGGDNSKGDGDKVAEQGEKIRLPIVLRNSGTAPALDVKATLRTASTLVTVVDSVKDYKVIGDGQEKDISRNPDYPYSNGFHFIVSNTAPSGEVIFTVKITTSNGGDFTDSVTVYIKGGGVMGPLEIVRFQIDDDVDNWGGGDNSKGDGDKMVERGEKIRLPIVLRNSGTAPALDVKATLRTTSSAVTVVDSVKDYKVIGDGQEKDISRNSDYPYTNGFHFTVSNTAPSGDVVFTIKITTSNGGSFSDQIILAIGKPSDLTAPVISFVSPLEKAKLPPRRFGIKLTFSDNTSGSGVDTTSLQISNSQDIGGANGSQLIKAGENLAAFFDISADSAQFTVPDSLAFPYGDNVLTASIGDRVGNLSKIASIPFKVDIFGIISPQNNSFVKQTSVTIEGFAIAPFVAKVKVNQTEVSIFDDAFSTIVNLVEGPNQIIAEAFDVNSLLLGLDTLNLILDTMVPSLAITSPLNGSTSSYSPIKVIGTVSDANNFTLKINDKIPKIENGRFEINISIDEGANIITANALDIAGNSSTRNITIYGTPPASPAGKIKLYLKEQRELSKFPFPPDPPNTETVNMSFIFDSNVWAYPLKGDINGGTYQFSLLVGCYGLGTAQMKASLTLRHQGQDISIGTTATFVGNMAGFTPLGYISPSRKDISISGIDPVSMTGDTLFLKITKVGGDRVGLIFLQCPRTGQSWITIPEVITSVDDHLVANVPREFNLSQNFPNPFNPTTMIKYQLPKECKVTISIYNMLGQRVITLLDETQPAGYYSIVWDGNNESNNPVASGMYLYSLRTAEFEKVRKMILIR